MKYIVTGNIDTDEQEIFIFSENIHHDCFAEFVGHYKTQKGGDWKRVRRQPISAGFTDGVKCWGYSETLKLKSRKHLDAELIK